MSRDLLTGAPPRDPAAHRDHGRQAGAMSTAVIVDAPEAPRRERGPAAGEGPSVPASGESRVAQRLVVAAGDAYRPCAVSSASEDAGDARTAAAVIGPHRVAAPAGPRDIPAGR